MVNIKLIRALETRINEIPHLDGQFIITKQGNIYTDFPNNERIFISGIDGKTYIPQVDNNYNLTWSESGVPPTNAINIKGPKGDKGDPFSIAKIYSSIEEMNAGYSTDGISLGSFVLINTGDVEDFENARLYVKGTSAYEYITDLSGAQGIQGPIGPQGPTGQNGTSAYLYAKEAGYTGTEEQFANKLAETPYKISVKEYGAKGDGLTNDTVAFQNALANNRIIYVPGGIYRLSSDLIIRNNCELELAQDAVLDFIQTSGNCITLNMSSNIKGNHATIKVPYTFDGNVIYASTTTTENTTDTENFPFQKWDPQWKNGRYITDINICKADSRGFHYSVNGETSGTAVYISADGNADLTYMWGLHYSGLRIAGAFSYGIRAKNLHEGWLHEMRIDAFIDACEIGVSLEDCQNTYISAIIQPRQYYTLEKVYGPYAKHGIQLIRSKNTDLSGSRVWDWDEHKTLWTYDGQYQHISMIGNCNGTIINDWQYHTQGDTRKRIYTDTASNLDTLTILQEPITRWFKQINGEPYFSSGLSEYKLITQATLDEYFDTDIVKLFEDILPVATNKNGSLFSDTGYKTNITLQSNGVDKENDGYYGATGFIPCKQENTIYVKDIDLSAGPNEDDGMIRFMYFDSNYEPLKYSDGVSSILCRHANLSDSWYYGQYSKTVDGFKLIIPVRSELANLAYIRFGFHVSTGLGVNPMISIDKEIKIDQAGFLADSIKVNDNNIESTKLNTLQTNVDNITQNIADNVVEFNTQINELETRINDKLNNLSITTEQADFILPAEGENVDVPIYTNVIEPYQDGVWNNAGTITTVANSIYIEPRAFDKNIPIRIRGIDFSQGGSYKPRIYLFNKEGQYSTVDNMYKIILDNGASGELSTGAGSYVWDAETFTLTVTFTSSNFTFGFGGGYATGYDATSVIMTVNEEIEYRTEWQGPPLRFDDTLYAQNVVLTSPGGNMFKLIVNDDGILTTTSFSLN